MIVKNEESVIRRALMSVIDNIDVFRIVDTGSTDRTIEIIEEVLAGRDYKVIQSDFKGFGPSRTEAYNLIKNECDWVLTMDADMELVGDIMVPEYGDAVWAVQVVQGAESKNYRLLGTHINWECIGMCHEYWKSDVYIEPTEQDFKLICHQDGGSNYINKNKMYLDLLRQDPDGARKFFYIAQTLFVMRKFVEAIGYYEKCINASIWDEEIWFCHFQIAKCMDYAGSSDSDVLAKL
jgi:glycosyltransferase involved in cell wall biosynthesis